MKPRFVPVSSRSVPKPAKDAIKHGAPWTEHGWRIVVRKSVDGVMIGQYAARVVYKRLAVVVKQWYYA